MRISEMQDIAKKVYELLHVNYGTYSKETLCNNALLELNDDLTLTAEDIADIIRPKLEAYQIRKLSKLKKMCKHGILEYKDTIEATTSIVIIKHDDLRETLDCNNEYGGRIREEVCCLYCGKNWKINNNSPKFVIDFVEHINLIR